MSLETLVLIGLTLFVASLIQGAVGFALSLFATPILVWGGVKLNHAVALVSVSILIQVLQGTYHLRREVRWREVFWGTTIRYATIPLGIGLLVAMVSLEVAQVKQVLGVILLGVIVAQLAWRVEPRAELHGGWRLLAFSCSGVMQGLAAMGGPPVVLWVMAHEWSSRESRAFLFSLFLLAAPLQVVLLYYSFGREILWPMLVGVAFTPVLAAGSSLGLRLGNLFTRARLRQVAFGLLLVIALSSILSPLFD